jgi:alpha-beta hydrolase superfamily lysophospholipase
MRRPVSLPEFRTWRMRDGAAIRGRAWPARASDPPVTFIVLHGIQSHGGWFEYSASLLAESGCPVILPDRRGSGLNAAGRGDAAHAQQWFEDLDDLVAAERAVRPTARVAAVGVSWGGKLAAAWALRGGAPLAGLLLIAPGVFPQVDVGWISRARIGLSLLVSPTRRFDIPLNDPALFTSNPRGQEFIRSDTLKLERATARFLYFSARLDARLRRSPAAALRVPATLLLAGRDRIIRNEPTMRWLRRVSADAPFVRTFPQASHTIEFESDVSDFSACLAEWRDRCCAGALETDSSGRRSPQ